MKQPKVPEAPSLPSAPRGPRYRYFSNPPATVGIRLGDLSDIPASAFTPFFDADRLVDIPTAELLKGPVPKISLGRLAELVPDAFQVGIHAAAELRVPASRLALAYRLVESRELIEEPVEVLPILPPVEETFAALDMPSPAGEKFAPTVKDLMSPAPAEKPPEPILHEAKSPLPKPPKVLPPAAVPEAKVEPKEAPKEPLPEPPAKLAPLAAPQPLAKEASIVPPAAPIEVAKPFPKVPEALKSEKPLPVNVNVPPPVAPPTPAEVPLQTSAPEPPTPAQVAPPAPIARRPFSFLPIFRRKVVEPPQPVVPSEPRTRVEIPKPKKPLTPISSASPEAPVPVPAAPIIPPPPAAALVVPPQPEIPALAILKEEVPEPKVTPELKSPQPEIPPPVVPKEDASVSSPAVSKDEAPEPSLVVPKDEAPEPKSAAEPTPPVAVPVPPPVILKEEPPAPPSAVPSAIPVPPPAVLQEEIPVVQPPPTAPTEPAALVPPPSSPKLEAVFLETEHLSEGEKNIPAEIPEQDGLQSLFLTEDVLSVERVVELCNGLPGIKSCILTRSGSVVNARNVPDSIDLISLSANALEMFRALRDSCAKMGIGAVPALTIHSQKGPITFFHEEDICLLVLHKDRGFVPGVREKLQGVVEELAKANLLLPVSGRGTKELK